MKSFRFRLMVAALAVALGSTMAKSQTAEDTPPTPPAHGHRMGMGDHLHFMAAKLNLTDDQKTQMKAIMEKEHPAMKPMFEQMRQIDQQLRQYEEGNFDEAKVQALALQKAQLQAQMTVHESRIHSEMYQVLTSDQKAHLKQMEAAHQARMQERMNQKPARPSEQ